MKTLFTLLTLSSLAFSFMIPPHGDEIDSSADEAKVKEAIVKWADATFHSHENYKFENFHAFWTEEYEINWMRTHAYEDMINELEADKKRGAYKGTDAEYQKEHDDLSTKLAEIKSQASGIKRAEYYQISFWTNCQTNDGITVYYEFIVKCDNDYKVFDALINSSIGAKSEKTEIVFKKDVDHSMVKKKSGNTVNPTNSNTGTKTDSGTDTGNGSVSIKTNGSETPPTEQLVHTDDCSGKKKKKKKKKK